MTTRLQHKTPSVHAFSDPRPARSPVRSFREGNLDNELAQATSLGTPLPDDVLGLMEPRFNFDFGQVKVHTDANADRLNQDLNAQALTHGQDIFFRAGEYSPDSSSGQRLIAHELTHIVQQANQSGRQDAISTPHDAAEQEADRAAEQVVAGQAVTVQAAPTGAISCSFLDGDDPENDFWGTKSNFGEQTGSTVDAAFNTFWDIAGMHPVGGVVSTGIDIAKMTGAGAMGEFLDLEAGARDFFGMGGGTGARLQSEKYFDAARRFNHDMSYDAMGAIPGLGFVQGLFNLQADSEETWNRYNGKKPQDMPGDYWHKMLKGVGL